MPELLILIALMVLLVVALGLPLLLGPDSQVPDYIGFALLTAMVALCIWAFGTWWILLPIAALVALVVWLDRGGWKAAIGSAGLDGRGRSARTRLLLRLWGTTHLVTFLLVVSVFFLPAGSAATIVVPGLTISLVASNLFRFGFSRSSRRDAGALPKAEPTASPAPFG